MLVKQPAKLIRPKSQLRTPWEYAPSESGLTGYLPEHEDLTEALRSGLSLRPRSYPCPMTRHFFFAVFNLIKWSIKRDIEA